MTGLECADASAPSGFRSNLPRATLPAVKVAPDERFAVIASDRGADVTFTGRLLKRGLRGARLRHEDGTCAGSVAGDARRTGCAT